MKIGKQVLSLVKYLQTPQDVLQTFCKLKSIGYKYVQIEWIGDEISTESVKESLDESGLICTGIQDTFDYIYEHIDDVINENKMWNGKYICGAVFIPKGKNEISELAAKLNEIAKKLASNNMILEIHPLFSAYIVTDGRMLLDDLWEQLDESILLQPDFYHVVRAKADPVHLIEKYSGRLDEAHFKDFRILDKNLDMTQNNNFDVLKQGDFPLTPVGQGIIPWKEIIDASLRHGVKYCFVEQEAILLNV